MVWLRIVFFWLQKKLNVYFYWSQFWLIFFVRDFFLVAEMAHEKRNGFNIQLQLNNCYIKQMISQALFIFRANGFETFGKSKWTSTLLKGQLYSLVNNHSGKNCC